MSSPALLMLYESEGIIPNDYWFKSFFRIKNNNANNKSD